MGYLEENVFAFFQKLLCFDNIKDGDYMWSASFDCTVRLWSSTADWSCIAVLSGHTHPVRALVLTQGYIVSGDYRGFIMIWDIKDVFTEITKFQIQQKKHKKQVTPFDYKYFFPSKI